MPRTPTVLAAITACALIAGCSADGGGCQCVRFDQSTVSRDAPASGVCQDLVQTDAQFERCHSTGSNRLLGPSDGLSFLKGPDFTEVQRKLQGYVQSKPELPTTR